MIKDFKKTAIIARDKDISYHEMLLRIERYASVSNTAPGMKTVIVGENREGWIYAFFSVWNNRGIPVPVDASSQPDDIAYILSDCQPSCIWTTTGKRGLVDQAQQIAGTDIQVHIIDNYEREPLADATPSEQSWERGSAVAVIIYTSGTTGSPKGVCYPTITFRPISMAYARISQSSIPRAAHWFFCQSIISCLSWVR